MDVEIVNGHPKNETLFERAEALVAQVFGTYGLIMDLVHTKEDYFTSIILHTNEAVVSCCEYVLMQKYLWIESLTVSPNFRHQGIGRALLQRLMKVKKIN